jgi:KDO2-lipid IV(A) lauroyltransferase
MRRAIKLIERLFLRFIRKGRGLIPLPLLRWLGEFLWRLYYYGSLRRRVRATERIARSLGVDWRTADEILRESLKNLVYTAVEFIFFTKFKRRGLWRLVERVEGFENLKKAKRMGKGIVAITAHYGNWELLGAWMVEMGFRLVAPGKRQTTEEANELIEAVRRSMGIKLLWKGSARNSYLKELKEGKKNEQGNNV